jgi:hypothetical protein
VPSGNVVVVMVTFVAEARAVITMRKENQEKNRVVVQFKLHHYQNRTPKSCLRQHRLG